MNTSTYNQSLNQAMPWTSKLQDIDVEELLGDENETLEDKLQRVVDTGTEYGEIIPSDNKGSTIL